MKLLPDMEQNSSAWKAWRRTHIGASDCPSILGKNPFSTATDIYNQKVLGEEIYYNADMQRGHLLEIEARKLLSERHKRDYMSLCAESIERPWQACSLDCYHERDGEIFCGEIKAPRVKNILKMQKQGVPDYYQWQMQHQMSVMGVNSMFFFAYSPEEEFYCEVPRVEYMIEDLSETEEIFYYDYMCSFEPPDQVFFDYLARKII